MDANSITTNATCYRPWRFKAAGYLHLVADKIFSWAIRTSFNLR